MFSGNMNFFSNSQSDSHDPNDNEKKNHLNQKYLADQIRRQDAKVFARAYSYIVLNF